jgi:ribonuclease HI
MQGIRIQGKWWHLKKSLDNEYLLRSNCRCLTSGNKVVNMDSREKRNRSSTSGKVKEKASNTSSSLQIWNVNTDGAIRPEQNASGLAAIVRDGQGKIRYWWQKKVRGMTCNEAEYAAVHFALEQMLRIQGREKRLEIAIYCDSRLVVDQMQGRAAAHAPALSQARADLQVMVARFKKVSFYHISREQNRLADALAFEAVEGWKTNKAQKAAGEIHTEVVDEFFSSWRSS